MDFHWKIMTSYFMKLYLGSLVLNDGIQATKTLITVDSNLLFQFLIVLLSYPSYLDLTDYPPQSITLTFDL